MARTLINAPKTAKRGEVIEIRATIGHPMETGFRPDENGKILPRNIIKKFSCRYNGELVFSAEMFAAVSANPYLAFHTLATESGTPCPPYSAGKESPCQPVEHPLHHAVQPQHGAHGHAEQHAAGNACSVGDRGGHLPTSRDVLIVSLLEAFGSAHGVLVNPNASLLVS